MKKTVLFLIVLLLVGCGKLGDNVKKDNYYFKAAKETITMGQAAEKFLTAAGTPMDKYSSPSCAFKGEDSVYDYGSYQVTTFLADGIEKFTGFYLKDNTVTTLEGIHIGSSFAEVEAAYGKDYKESYGAYTYRLGLTDLSFVIIDNVVTSISYLYAVK